MSIENDIQQARFRNDYQRASINLIYTYNWMMQHIKTIVGQQDITPQQFNILRILRGAGKPLSTLQIRQRMLDKMSDTSRIVDRLLAKSLVQKVVCENDRRLVDVTITEQGLALLEKLDTHQDELDEVFKNLSSNEAQTLNQLLDKIRNSN